MIVRHDRAAVNGAPLRSAHDGLDWYALRSELNYLSCI